MSVLGRFNIFSPFPSLLPPRNLRQPSSISAKLPARDRVIDFGKHKGRMLGTLPSKYLTWVSKNLRARDFEDWAKLADEVLLDPVYKDRVEWELAERVLSGEGLKMSSGNSKESSVSELLVISESFGWDNDDKEGWKAVNVELLGTSSGGRIPRRNNSKNSNSKRLVEFPKEVAEEVPAAVIEGGRERRRMRRHKPSSKSKVTRREVEIDGGDNEVKGNSNPFPGRKALLAKIDNMDNF